MTLVGIQYPDKPPENVTARNAGHCSFSRYREPSVSHCTSSFLLGSPPPRLFHTHAQKIRTVQNSAHLSGNHCRWSNVHTCMIIVGGCSFLQAELGKEKLLESLTSFPAHRTPNVHARYPFQVAVSTCSLLQSRNAPFPKDSPGFLHKSNTEP